ncbi:MULTISPECIES: metal ABC transporter ATP-binding protein [Clostridium]|jgi:zinc/manganese transport system ATP-binding protein|uniref:Metal ABC transporter ATP-binding protein n=1 Tax=Clostridium lapidicellarium TaxID=3240931 RepID=A0ABV4DX47_9CLOT|nr:metal ABC transporter ATP-binding protein [Clostridiales bacterium]
MMNYDIPEKNKPILSLDNIGVNFGKKQVLKNINFCIYPGEFIGLIGSNGAGKSTLLKVILGLLPPSSGNVNTFDKNGNPKKITIGYVPQKIYLDPGMPLRGRDLAALGLDGNKWGIPLPSKKKNNKVNTMLELVDAARYADFPVGKLSGGEQQRLLIAQALLTDPQLLLLDEPLSSLDIKSSYEIVHLVSQISNRRKVAVILVAHDMNPLLGAMDRVLYLAGRSSVIGKVDDIFRSDVLSKLYGYKIEVLHINGRILVIGSQNPSDMKGGKVKVE